MCLVLREAELIGAFRAAAAPLLAHGDRPRPGAGRAPPRRKRDPHVPSRRGAPVHETLEEPADHWGTAGARSRSARRTFGRKGHDPSLCWVALDGDEIVSANLADWKREGDWAGSACSASGARRRRGIAEALLTTAFGEFFRRGERCIALNVDAESAPARARLYVKVGMRVISAPSSTRMSSVPPELTLRPPTLDDIPAVTALLKRVAEADGAGWIDEEALRGWFTHPNFPIAEDAVLGERAGEPVVYADVYRGGDAREKVWGDLRVPPEERSGAVLPQLVDWMEERAGPARLRLEFSEHVGEVRAELERRGYTPVRYAFEMERDLDAEPPVPHWPEGVSVRTLRAGEERRIYEVDAEAFADHWDFTETPFDEWRHWHMEDHFDPTCWFIAEGVGEIAGISILSSRARGAPGGGLG